MCNCSSPRRAIAAGSRAGRVAPGLSAADASAATATFTGLGLGGSVHRIIDDSATGTQAMQAGPGSASFNVHGTGGTVAGALPTGVADNFLAICIEPQDTIGIGGSDTFVVVDLSDGPENIGGRGVTKSNRIGELLFGVALFPFPFPFTTAMTGSALQIAIREIVREAAGTPLDAASGHTRCSTAAPAAALAQAQLWLTTYVNDGDDPGQRAGNALALASDSSQDVLAFVHVPAPGALPLPGLARVGLGIDRRRRPA